ncbi:hypothetical protein [Anaerobium acetethylicum]|uniref:Uncharacterized protein n=1 Tax=Anaerobium acetethylicum TaxID=1619234 RepID=A0A1D3TUI7_9FIRM|nr:hypothetical protein [Anaerobium acetethylicum]SCP97717.1 hypothetical protein SAMN05421730_101327 [Anaerobium acetethylicum]
MRILLKDYETGDLYIKESYEASYGVVDYETQQTAVTFFLSDGSGAFGVPCLTPEEGNELVKKVAVQGYIDLTDNSNVYFELAEEEADE